MHLLNIAEGSDIDSGIDPDSVGKVEMTFQHNRKKSWKKKLVHSSGFGFYLENFLISISISFIVISLVSNLRFIGAQEFISLSQLSC